MGEVTSHDKNKPDEKSDALGIAFRQVGAIAGGIGVVNILRDLLEWHLKWQHNIEIFLDAFRSFSRPVASYLFGWLPALFHLSFPGWAKEYLTVGVIIALASTRLMSYIPANRMEESDIGRRIDLDAVIFTLYFVVTLVWLWPRVFLSVYVYAALIMVANYVLVAAGAKTE